MNYQFQIEGGKLANFTKTGKKAVKIYKNSGEYLVNGDIICADGTKFRAILVIDTWSSGEHGGTYILLEDGVAEQGMPDFLSKIGKTENEFFPYRYKYNAMLPCEDHHVGPDGWS
jgi:hypothetical protein